MTVRRFALDEGFPLPIVQALKKYLPNTVELVSLGEIDDRLSGNAVADWQLLLALHHRGFDGLVAVDSTMLSQPAEMCVLQSTRLTLVVAQKSGHDPLVATGLVLAHIAKIANDNTRRKAQVWQLKKSEARHILHKTSDLIDALARRHNMSPRAFVRKHRLSKEELKKDPLANDAKPP